MKHYLGYLDATQEEEQKHYLPHTFVKTKATMRALDDDICFVCGRRGAGKSAVVTMLNRLKDSEGKIYFKSTRGIYEEDYQVLHVIFLQELYAIIGHGENVNSNLELCFFGMWSLILDLFAMQTIVDVTNSNDDCNKVEAYLRQIECSDCNPIDFVTNKAMNIIKEANNKALLLTSLALYFRQFRNNRQHKDMLGVVSDLTVDCKIALFIDTMEKYDISDFKIYPLRGLCLAVKEFVTKKRFSNIQIKCCLPAEVTNELFQKNLAKFHESSVFLHWSSSDLLEFLAKRFYLYLEKENNSNYKELAKEIYDCINRKEISGSKNKYWFVNFWTKIAVGRIFNKFNSPENSCTYLIRHTQKRPREVLSCMNYILEYSIERKQFPFLSEKTIVNGIHDGDNLWQLLTDNLSIFHFPKVDKNIFDLASTLLADEKIVFEGKEYSRFSKRALSKLSGIDVTDKASYAKNLLIRSGLVGRVIQYSKQKPAHEWNDPETQLPCKYYVTEFEYLVPEKVIITEESFCAVHPMLGDKLKLTNDDGDIGVVYPIPEKDDINVELVKVYENKEC